MLPMMKIIGFSLLLLSLFGCSADPMAAWKNANAKAKKLLSLEARYEALQREHERLRTEHYRLESEHAELKAKMSTRLNALQNLESSGSVTGRSLASITYKVPNGLKPEQLQALAYEHLREERFPEAAVSFEQLLTQPEAISLQDSEAMYSAGVAWFQAGNLKKAREHLTSAKEHASGENKEKTQKKVDLWLRVIDRKFAEEKKHPSTDHGRIPASAPKEAAIVHDPHGG